MSLGLLAKDSIQDLANLARESSDSLDHDGETSGDPGDSKEVAVLLNGGSLHRPGSPSGSSTASSTPEQLSPQSPKDGSSLAMDNIDSRGGSLENASSISRESTAAADANGVNGNTSLDLPHAQELEGEEAAHVANPQQAQDNSDDQPDVASAANAATATTSSTTYGQYAGFRADYYNNNAASASAATLHSSGDHHMDTGNYYAHDTYAPMIIGGSDGEGHNHFFPKLINCIFPWLSNEPDEKRTGAGGSAFESQTYEQETVDHSSVSTGDPVTLRAVTTATTASGGEGQEQEQQQDKKPSRAAPSRSEDDEKSSDSDALGEKLSAKERKAVLARLGLAQPDAAITSAGAAPSQGEEGKMKEKKGLLSEYELQNGGKHRRTKSILKKRTSQVDLRNKQMANNKKSHKRRLFPSYETPSSAARVSNNVQFSPMARVVTVKSRNDMSRSEKGDVWWQKTDYEDFRKTGRIITKAMLAGGSEIWLSQSESSAPSPTGDAIPRATGDKWWHKFGHSRRGLEHVVSMAEGRDRQINVRTAIQAVLDEQTRQKMYHREDIEKLRIVALNHTSWARDLALAAGHSDADAVRSAFAENRKSREFYLLKMSRTNNTTPNVRRHVVPNFMQPAVHAATGPSGRLTSSQQHRLDANTAAQISYRRRQLASQSSSMSASGSTSGTPSKSNATPPARAPESSEPIRDPNPEDTTEESLAHRAAGFSVDGEKVDISAVLSGMGVAAAAATVAS